MALASREYLADWACNKNIFLNIYIYIIYQNIQLKKEKETFLKKERTNSKKDIYGIGK